MSRSNRNLKKTKKRKVNKTLKKNVRKSMNRKVVKRCNKKTIKKQSGGWPGESAEKKAERKKVAAGRRLAKEQERVRAAEVKAAEAVVKAKVKLDYMI